MPEVRRRRRWEIWSDEMSCSDEDMERLYICQEYLYKHGAGYFVLLGKSLFD